MFNCLIDCLVRENWEKLLLMSQSWDVLLMKKVPKTLFPWAIENTPKCFSAPAGWAPAGPSPVSLNLPPPESAWEDRSHLSVPSSCSFNLPLRSLTHLLFFSRWLSRNLTKFFCTIESMILLISLAMADSAYLFLRPCSSSLRHKHKSTLFLWPLAKLETLDLRGMLKNVFVRLLLWAWTIILNPSSYWNQVLILKTSWCHFVPTELFALVPRVSERRMGHSSLWTHLPTWIQETDTLFCGSAHLQLDRVTWVCCSDPTSTGPPLPQSSSSSLQVEELLAALTHWLPIFFDWNTPHSNSYLPPTVVLSCISWNSFQPTSCVKWSIII